MVQVYLGRQDELLLAGREAKGMTPHHGRSASDGHSAPPPEVALPCLWLWCTRFMTRVRSFFPRAALGIPAELSTNRTTSDPSNVHPRTRPWPTIHSTLDITPSRLDTCGDKAHPNKDSGLGQFIRPSGGASTQERDYFEEDI